MVNTNNRIEHIYIYLKFKSSNFNEEITQQEKYILEKRYIEKLNSKIEELLNYNNEVTNYTFNVKQIIKINKKIKKYKETNEYYYCLESDIYLLLKCKNNSKYKYI